MERRPSRSAPKNGPAPWKEKEPINATVPEIRQDPADKHRRDQCREDRGDDGSDAQHEQHDAKPEQPAGGGAQAVVKQAYYGGSYRSRKSLAPGS